MSHSTFTQLKSLSFLPRTLFLELLFRLGLAKKVLARGLSPLTQKMAASPAFNQYVPSKHDVFAATYVKSGTNWSMQICQQIACRGEAEFEHIHHLVAWPDYPLWVTPGAQNIVSLEDKSVQANTPTGLRVIKTHLPASNIPYSEEATYISIIRDPKDVCVSAYYYSGAILNFLDYLSPDDWFDISLMPGSILSGWVEHSASFWAWRDRPNVLVLTFNEMKQNPTEAIARIAKIMGVSLTEAEFAQVLERSSFQYMKEIDDKFAPVRASFIKGKQVTMMRKGKSGGSDELLSKHQQATIDQFCQDGLNKLGSDFPYETLFNLL